MISKKVIETERSRFEVWLTDQDWCSVPLDVVVSLRNPDHILTTDPINSGSDPYIFEESDCRVAEDFLLAVGAMYAGWMAAVERRYEGGMMITELNDKMFPIVIKITNVGEVTFTSPTTGVFDCGEKTGLSSLEYFIKKAKETPEDYVIDSAGGYRFPITFRTHRAGLITFYSFNAGKWHKFDSPTNEITTYHQIAYFFGRGYEIVDYPSDSVVKGIVEDTDPNYKECAIEDMPLGVKLVGFKDGDTFVELVMTPNFVEVGMECINLLVRRDPPLDIVAEVNFKRGQIIRYTK